MNINLKMREYKKTAKAKMRDEIEKMAERVKLGKFASHSEKLETIRENKVEIKKRFKKTEEAFLNIWSKPKHVKAPLTQAQIQKIYRDRLRDEKAQQKAIAEALAVEFGDASEVVLMRRATGHAAKGNLEMVLKISKHIELNMGRQLKLHRSTVVLM